MRLVVPKALVTPRTSAQCIYPNKPSETELTGCVPFFTCYITYVGAADTKCDCVCGA